MKQWFSTTVLFTALFSFPAYSQDTFSIVAVDSVTGEVGSAGASCVDLFTISGYSDDFLGELFPGVGAINTQAQYLQTNQVNARNRMNAGDTPSQIINWLVANDATGTPQTRQYGIVRLVSGSPQSAAYTGSSCQNYKNHRLGPNYSIQGNILLGKVVLDSMEARFNREPGDLACKLMAALQGANMVGADTRCTSNGTSSLFAFVKVAKPSDTFGNPSFLVSVRTRNNAGIEPVDTLQTKFDLVHGCSTTGLDAERQTEPKYLAYPNPAHTFVTVPSALSGQGKVVVRSVLGRKVSEVMPDDKGQINIASLPSGIYLVEIPVSGGRIVRRFIKE